MPASVRTSCDSPARGRILVSVHAVRELIRERRRLDRRLGRLLDLSLLLLLREEGLR